MHKLCVRVRNGRRRWQHVEVDVAPECQAVERSLVHHPFKGCLRQRITLTSATHIGMSADKPSLLDLRECSPVVRRQSPFLKIDGPKRRRESFPVLINSESVKGRLVCTTEAGVKELHICLPQDWKVSKW